MNKLNKNITIARAIIRIGDAARNANDYSLLDTLHEMVEQLSQNGVKDADVDMDLLLEYVEAADGCDYCRAGGQAQVEAGDQPVLEFEPIVHLVTVAYAKKEDGVTSGLSIALVVNQDGSVDLPREHFLNAELLDYFDENHPINWRRAESDLPRQLQGYHLVAGSVEVQEILPRELEAMSF